MENSEKYELENSDQGKKDTRFKPGEGGRRKGSVNKVTVEQKKRVEWVLELLEESLEDSIEKLKPKDKVELWASLQEYIRPKLQRMNLELDPADKKISKITFEIVKSGTSPSSEAEANTAAHGQEG